MVEQQQALSQNQAQILAKRARQAREDKLAEAQRQRLSKIVCTKIRTSFIGALAAFEDEFGFLWGATKPETEDLTPEEDRMYDLWERVRTKVLNNGNGQLRAAQNEISNHSVEWNRHHIDFVIKPEEQGQYYNQ